MIISVLFFAVCGVALVLGTLLERRRHPEATVGELFDRTMAGRPARVSIVLIWWWLGWHFLAGQTL